jgi:hypothetical protein
MNAQNLNPDDIAEAVVCKMKEHHHTMWIDPETHSNQHEFIAALIKERQDKEIRRKRIQDRIAGSIILSALTGLVTLLGVGALDWLRNHLK